METRKIAFSEDEARKKGYMGAFRRVTLTHCLGLARRAVGMGSEIDRMCFPEPPPGGEVEGSMVVERTLERMENLLEHAAQEIRDERLRLRDGWSE